MLIAIAKNDIPRDNINYQLNGIDKMQKMR